MKRSQGFVFIDLLSTAAIITILAAVAIPAYSDYKIRSYSSEGFIMATKLRKVIGDYYAYHGRLPENNESLQLAATSFTTKTINRMEVKQGEIHIFFHYPDALKDNVLVLAPTINKTLGHIRWQCTQESTLETQYLPNACRKNMG